MSVGWQREKGREREGERERERERVLSALQLPDCPCRLLGPGTA